MIEERARVHRIIEKQNLIQMKDLEAKIKEIVGVKTESKHLDMQPTD